MTKQMNNVNINSLLMVDAPGVRVFSEHFLPTGETVRVYMPPIDADRLEPQTMVVRVVTPNGEMVDSRYDIRLVETVRN